MARVFTQAGGQLLATASQTRLTLDTFSVAFWIFRTASQTASGDLFSTGGSNSTDGWTIQLLLTSNVIRGMIPAGTTSKVRDSSTAPALNTWVHVVVTHLKKGLLSTDFLFYFNGKQEAGTNNSSQSGTHNNNAQPFTVGKCALGENVSPSATLGQFAIWDRIITPAEALALAGGAHPTRFKEGLADLFEMQTAHGEFGFNNTYLVQGAVNPTSAAVNPPMEAIPSSLFVNRTNYRTRRARYFVPASASGVLPQITRVSQAVKRGAYY